MKKREREVILRLESTASIARASAANLGTIGQADDVVKQANGHATVAAYLAVCCYASRLGVDLMSAHHPDGTRSAIQEFNGNAESFMLALREAAVRELLG